MSENRLERARKKPVLKRFVTHPKVILKLRSRKPDTLALERPDRTQGYLERHSNLDELTSRTRNYEHEPSNLS